MNRDRACLSEGYPLGNGDHGAGISSGIVSEYAARNDRGYLVAHTDVLHLRAKFCDDSGSLKTEDVGKRFEGWIFAFRQFELGKVDARGLYLDQDLVWTGLRLVSFDNSHALESIQP